MLVRSSMRATGISAMAENDGDAMWGGEDGEVGLNLTEMRRDGGSGQQAGGRPGVNAWEAPSSAGGDEDDRDRIEGSKTSDSECGW
jgi:hypothetical protein